MDVKRGVGKTSEVGAGRRALTRPPWNFELKCFFFSLLKIGGVGLRVGTPLHWKRSPPGTTLGPGICRREAWGGGGLPHKVSA